jgi:hypothetical protein
VTVYRWANLDRGSDEWDYAWAIIAAKHGDTVCQDPTTGEVWQYMGSYDEGAGWFHGFRHRDLNGLGRALEDISASPEWAPEDVRENPFGDDSEIPF